MIGDEWLMNYYYHSKNYVIDYENYDFHHSKYSNKYDDYIFEDVDDYVYEDVYDEDDTSVNDVVDTETETDEEYNDSLLLLKNKFLST
jgi:hypothetical protein